MDDRLAFAPASQLAAMLRGGALTSRELTAFYLDRIDKLADRTRSYVHVMRETAEQEALRADRERAAGLDRGLFHGLPVATKDLLDAEGIPTAAGMSVRKDHVAQADSTVIRRLRAAGAVILGKLATTEGASTAHHPSIPVPLNPWNAGHCCGFSSSGSGVAVAAGLCVAAIGTDTGGSIRTPSAYNGLTGLKPTWGRVSQFGSVPLVEYFDVIGPMAHSAFDAAAMLGAIAGHDPEDPMSSTEPVPNYLSSIGNGVGGLRVGIDAAGAAALADPSVMSVFHETAAQLAARGVRIRAVELPAIDIMQIMPLMMIGVGHAHRAFFPARASEYGAGLAAALRTIPQIPSSAIVTALNLAETLKARIRAVFAEVDLLLTPAMPTVAPPVGMLEKTLSDDLGAYARHFGFMFPFNVTGSPCIAFPAGFEDGLPIGMQLVGRHFEEDLLFRTAHDFQTVTDWHLRRPPLADDAGDPP